MARQVATIMLILSFLGLHATASDWRQFRGPNGQGISSDKNVPLVWGETKNLKWKAPLPGPGSSSPIVCGDKIFVTCYSGYGIDRSNPGKVIYRERLSARGGGKPFYASVVLVDQKLYAVSRTSGTFVLSAEPEFKQLARNQIESDSSDFHGSPAIIDGQIFLRSNRYLYCIEDEG